MRKTLIAILTVFMLVSCDSSDKKSKNNEVIQEEATVDKKETFVKTLDYKTFIKKVWDIESHPDSVAYQGKLPCIIDFYADWC